MRVKYRLHIKTYRRRKGYAFQALLLQIVIRIQNKKPRIAKKSPTYSNYYV